VSAASVLAPGPEIRGAADRLLPAGWAWEGKRVLDFGFGRVGAAGPSLPLEDGSLDLVLATSVFTPLTDHWSGWLLELHRVLASGGILIAAFPGEELSRAVADRPWDDARAGTTVTSNGESFEIAGSKILVSPWWTCARWRRAFDILRVEQSGFMGNGHGVVVAGRP
jgi:SAM-dependent methyltransferase